LPGPAPSAIYTLSLHDALPISRPRSFESRDFVVVLARRGDTPESLAASFLGDPAKAWMIDDYNDGRDLAPGQEVVIPKHDWNARSEEHTSELQSRGHLVCRLLL